MNSKQAEKQSFTKLQLSKRNSLDSLESMKTVSRYSDVESDQTSSDGSLIMLFKDLLGPEAAAESESIIGIDWSNRNYLLEWKKSREKSIGKSPKSFTELEFDIIRKYQDSFVSDELSSSELNEKELSDRSLSFARRSDSFRIEAPKPIKRYHSQPAPDYQSNILITRSQDNIIFTKDVYRPAHICGSACNRESINFKNNIGDCLCLDTTDDKLEYAGTNSSDYFKLVPIFEQPCTDYLSCENYNQATLQKNILGNQDKLILNSTRKALVRCQSHIVGLVFPRSKPDLSTAFSPARSVSSQLSPTESELATLVPLNHQEYLSSNDLDNLSETNLQQRKSNLSRMVYQAKNKLQSKLENL